MTASYTVRSWLFHLFLLSLFLGFVVVIISVPYFIYFYFTHLYPFFLTVLISSAQFKLLSAWFDSYPCLYKSDPIHEGEKNEIFLGDVR